jgi:hypothetical protein
MGAGTSTSHVEEPQETERTPLLPDSDRPQHEEPAPAKKAGRWLAQNAVTFFSTTLILAVVIALCVFFGGKSAPALQFPVLELRLTSASPPSQQAFKSTSLPDSCMRSRFVRNSL